MAGEHFTGRKHSKSKHAFQSLGRFNEYCVAVRDVPRDTDEMKLKQYFLQSGVINNISLDLDKVCNTSSFHNR